MRVSLYRNYLVTDDGRIFDEELNPVKIKENGNIDYKQKNGQKYTIECIPARLFIYMAFHKENMKPSEVIYCKDGNNTNLKIENLVLRDMCMIDKPVLYYGYLVSVDGSIMNKRNKKLRISKNGFVGIYLPDENGVEKKRMMVAGRFVYEALSDYKIERNTPLRFEDGDKCNIHISNLTIQSRRKYFSTSEQKMKFSEEQCDEIRKIYNNKKTYDTKEVSGIYPSVITLARQFNCGPSTIQKILKNMYQKREFKEEITRYIFDIENITDIPKILEKNMTKAAHTM